MTNVWPEPPTLSPPTSPLLPAGTTGRETGVALSVVLLTTLFAVDVAWILVSSSVDELRFGARWIYAVAQAVEFGLFAVVVAVVGRSQVRRVAAAGVALLAGAVVVAWVLAFPRLATTSEGPHLVEVLGWLLACALPLLLVGAWGVARRLGELWLVALPFSAALGAVMHKALEVFTTHHLSWYPQHLTWIQLVNLVATWAPVVLTGLLAWGLDTAQRRPAAGRL
jgi:hypothetical protein